MTDRPPGRHWPSRRDELLLRAALLPDERALDAWAELQPTFVIDELVGEPTRLLPLLGRNLVTLGVDSAESERLVGVSKQVWYRTQLLLGRVEPLLAGDAASGPAPVLLRGAAAIASSYRDGGLRRMNDVDLLVEPSRAADVTARLRSLGWRAVPGAPRPGRVRFELEPGVRLVLHPDASHNLLPHDPRVHLDCAGHATLDGRAVRVLSPADQLLVTVLDGARPHSDAILRYSADAWSLLQAVAVDWGRLISQATAHRCTATIADGLAYLVAALDTPVPADALDDLSSLGTRAERLTRHAPESVSRYARLSATAGPAATITGVVPYLRSTWELDRGVDVPGEVARRGVRALRGSRPAPTAAAIMLACLRHELGRPDGLLDDVDDGTDLRGLPDLARYHRVVGAVLHALKERTVDEEALAGLRGAHHAGRRSHLLALAAVRSIAPVLDELDVTWLVVKGPVVAEAVWRRSDLRHYGDLDLVAPPAGIEDAVRALAPVGWRLIDRNWPLILELMAGEVHLADRTGRITDLHWHLLFSRELRQRFPIPMDALRERAVEVEVGGTAVRTLDPADTLLHLAFHAALEGGDRLVWVGDVDRAVTNLNPAWDDVVTRARAWHVGIPVATMLQRARHVLGTPVPSDVLAALAGGRGWLALTAAAGRAFPVERSTGRGTPATLVARAARESAPVSLREVASGLVHRTTRAARQRSLDADRTRFDPRDPRSILYSAGTDDDRARYFAALRAGTT